jgi:hypothetical protein
MGADATTPPGYEGVSLQLSFSLVLAQPIVGIDLCIALPTYLRLALLSFQVINLFPDVFPYFVFHSPLVHHNWYLMVVKRTPFSSSLGILDAVRQGLPVAMNMAGFFHF